MYLTGILCRLKNIYDFIRKYSFKIVFAGEKAYLHRLVQLIRLKADFP